MARQIHSLVGLLAALVICVLAVTGAILSTEPVIDRMFSAPSTGQQASVAEFASAMQVRHPELDKIVRAPSGVLVVTYFENDKASAVRVDPLTLRELGPHQASSFMRLVTSLHRSFLLGDAGRVTAGLSALAMLGLIISGAMLLAARLGGWHALLKPIRGTVMQRWHAELGRAAMLFLLLSALTGCYMSLTTHGLLPEGTTDVAAATGSGSARLPAADVAALKTVRLDDLRELSFPYSADLTDVYTLTTAAGVSRIDAATGDTLDSVPHSLAHMVVETVYQLHTGQGLWPLAILLGIAAACVPIFTVTGGLIWWKRRQARDPIAGNVAAADADTIILVGTEGNTTWGFARALHVALTAAGHRVHAAPMNAMPKYSAAARRVLILTATYGDGFAPASASAFLETAGQRLAPLPYAVLGFGDRSFPRFCAFADAVDGTLAQMGWPRLMDIARIDRQSAQSFTQWGEALGSVLGHPLHLEHAAARPVTRSLVLAARTDYGHDVQAPTSVMRFKLDHDNRLWPRRRPRFEAGDLLGIFAPGTDQPRFYSLASSSRDGVLEICVSKQPGGLCSGFLHDLVPGDAIEAFIRPNPSFRPAAGKAPLILIGAGTGIGPLIGFIRQNEGRRPLHLYWGGRNPASDFLYRDELASLLANRKLTSLQTAFSRIPGGGYVQDRLAGDEPIIARLICSGAQVLVCGGREMAGGVKRALDTILTTSGGTLAGLKAEGRYVEDVY